MYDQAVDWTLLLSLRNDLSCFTALCLLVHSLEVLRVVTFQNELVKDALKLNIICGISKLEIS